MSGDTGDSAVSDLVQEGEADSLRPLVFAGETDALRQNVLETAHGERVLFIMDVGNVHSYDGTGTRRLVKCQTQIASLLAFATGRRVVSVISFNSASTGGARGRTAAHDLAAEYASSSSFINLVRAFVSGGYGHLSNVRDWNQEFADATQDPGDGLLIRRINSAISFISACGVRLETCHGLEEGMSFFAQPPSPPTVDLLTRRDSISGSLYQCDAHLTYVSLRSPDSDLQRAAKIANPVAIVLRDDDEAGDELVRLCERLDPERVGDRLVLISEMSAHSIRAELPALIGLVYRDGFRPALACNPFTAARSREAATDLLSTYLDVCSDMGRTVDSVVVPVGGSGSVPPDHTTPLRLGESDAIAFALDAARLLERSSPPAPDPSKRLNDP